MCAIKSSTDWKGSARDSEHKPQVSRCLCRTALFFEAVARFAASSVLLIGHPPRLAPRCTRVAANWHGPLAKKPNPCPSLLYCTLLAGALQYFLPSRLATNSRSGLQTQTSIFKLCPLQRLQFGSFLHPQRDRERAIINSCLSCLLAHREKSAAFHSFQVVGSVRR